jgi:hypothetical protein
MQGNRSDTADVRVVTLDIPAEGIKSVLTRLWMDVPTQGQDEIDTLDELDDAIARLQAHRERIATLLHDHRLVTDEDDAIGIAMDLMAGDCVVSSPDGDELREQANEVALGARLYDTLKGA